MNIQELYLDNQRKNNDDISSFDTDNSRIKVKLKWHPLKHCRPEKNEKVLILYLDGTLNDAVFDGYNFKRDGHRLSNPHWWARISYRITRFG